ncbi:hypothetical protein P7C70_g9643, partial [Phenoliferia sp. Uapishka_3]
HGAHNPPPLPTFTLSDSDDSSDDDSPVAGPSGTSIPKIYTLKPPPTRQPTSSIRPGHSAKSELLERNRYRSFFLDDSDSGSEPDSERPAGSDDSEPDSVRSAGSNGPEHACDEDTDEEVEDPEEVERDLMAIRSSYNALGCVTAADWIAAESKGLRGRKTYEHGLASSCGKTVRRAVAALDEAEKHAKRTSSDIRGFFKATPSSSTPRQPPPPRSPRLPLPNLAPELDGFESDSEDEPEPLQLPPRKHIDKTKDRPTRDEDRARSKAEEVVKLKLHVASLEKLLRTRVLPTPPGEIKHGRREEWESNLQARRVSSLSAFYNFRLAGCGKIQASKKASQSLGRSAGWG